MWPRVVGSAWILNISIIPFRIGRDNMFWPCFCLIVIVERMYFVLSSTILVYDDSYDLTSNYQVDIVSAKGSSLSIKS